MRTLVLNFSKELAPLTTQTERFFFDVGLWRISSLEIVFQVGQAGTLFIRPMAERVCGTRDDLLLPEPEVTGDNWSFHVEKIPLVFVPGSALRFELRNTSSLHSRRYIIVAEMVETIEEEVR